jgi:hypothetical protein
MSLAIVFHAEFRGGRGSGRRRGGDDDGDGGRETLRGSGPLDTPLGETVAAYAISLAVSVVLLWSFGLTDGAGPAAIVAMTVVLGFVASFGAAAGRLLLGGGEAPRQA